MEPNEQKDTEVKQGAEDLHAEGIDIVGSSMALDNEYSQPEVHNARSSEAEEEAVEESAPEAHAAAEASPAEPQPATPEPPARPPEAPKPEPAPAQTEPVPPAPAPQNDPSIKPFRSFKTDAEEAVRGGNLSKIQIAVAQEKKRESTGEATYEDAKKASPGLYIALVLGAIVILGGGWYAWFSMTARGTNEAPAATIALRTPIPYAKAGIVVVGQGSEGDTDPIALVAAKLGAANPGLGNVYAAAPVAAATSTSVTPIAGLLSATNVSDRLLRSLSNDYMIGTYAYDVSGPFIILRDTYYQNAFAGMLDWENSMGQDLLPLIRISHPNDTIAPSGSFSDAVVSNIDTRELRDASGDVVLAYAFPDQNTIVIATTEHTLKYLLDMLLQVRTIQ